MDSFKSSKGKSGPGAKWKVHVGTTNNGQIKYGLISNQSGLRYRSCVLH
jgi:hypothetical protein